MALIASLSTATLSACGTKRTGIKFHLLRDSAAQLKPSCVFFFFLDVCDSLHLSPGDGNLIELHVSGPSAAGRQDLCLFFAWVWRDGGAAKSRDFRSLLSNQRIIVTPSLQLGGDVEGGGVD